jgi:hypothetical protein
MSETTYENTKIQIPESSTKTWLIKIAIPICVDVVTSVDGQSVKKR